jgi:fused signal recognition particle receptor
LKKTFKAIKEKVTTPQEDKEEEEKASELTKGGPKKPPSKLAKKLDKKKAAGKPEAQLPIKKTEKEWAKVGQKELVSDDVEGGFFDGKKLTDKMLDDILWDLEIGLLEADVAHPVAQEIKGNVRNELIGLRVKRSLKLEEVIEQALRNAVSNTLTQKQVNFDLFIKTSDKPVVIMFVGVNGTGKTTAIAKIAHRLKKKGYSVALAAGDTFRAGAIEQLEKHADNLGIKLVKNKAGSDPASVAYDAVEHAKARHKDVVLLDTAGRMQTNINLMDEMKKMRRVANPGMVIFVGDSLAGNDSVIQAQKFDEAVSIDGVILTKIDADAKGGAALSIAHAIGKPLLFVGTGQGYDDLVPFDPNWMVERLFS